MRKLLYTSIVVPLILIAAILFGTFLAGDALDGFSILVVFGLGCTALFSILSLILHRTQMKGLVEKLWLALLVSLFTYTAADLLAGYILIQPLSPKGIRDRYLHHRLIPNTSSNFASPDYNHFQRVNNLGLRGPDIDPVKQPGVYRILMLGDSFTMGKGVEDDQTFSALLEKSLNSRPGAVDGKNVQVLNAGVDSYAPVLSFLLLKRDLIGLKPDLVILNLDMSDLEQETAYRNSATFGPDGEIVGVNGIPTRGNLLSLLTKVESWINRNMYFTRLWLFYLSRTVNAADVNVENTVNVMNRSLLQHTLTGDQQDRTAQWRNIFESLLKMNDYCRSHGIEFLMTVYPWGHQVSNREWRPGRNPYVSRQSAISDKSIDAIRQFTQEKHINMLDVFPAFRSYKGEALLYFKHDVHWTTEGHRLMAQELERHLAGLWQ